MPPRYTPPSPRRASKVSLLISLGVHALVVCALAYFAAREGLLGKQLKKIAVEMVKEKAPEKPKEQAKPKQEPPKLAQPKIDPIKAPTVPPPVQPRAEVPAAPSASLSAPPAVAPPAVDVSSFVFEGGKAVETSTDRSEVYKGFVEYALRANWNRPTDLEDRNFVAEVEVRVDREGRVRSPEWKRRSGNPRWDRSVDAALSSTSILSRPPPKGFPDRVLVRFDVQEVTEPVTP